MGEAVHRRPKHGHSDEFLSIEESKHDVFTACYVGTVRPMAVHYHD